MTTHVRCFHIYNKITIGVESGVSVELHYIVLELICWSRTEVLF